MEQEEFAERRRKKAMHKIGTAVADELGVTAEGLADIVGDACPDQVREALAEAFDRALILRQIHEHEAAKEEEPGRCNNRVCQDWAHAGSDGYCRIGATHAVGCLFRMREEPPNHLEGVTCAAIPEWSEAINMLRQAGILEPDEWGRWNGTDFTHKTERVWWAFVHLLVETGKIDRCWVEDAGFGMEDCGKQSELARALLFPAEEE